MNFESNNQNDLFHLICLFLTDYLPLSKMFPKRQTLALYNIPEMSYDDLGPYLAMIPFLQHIKLDECSLTKTSSWICSNLLGRNTISQLKSCTLRSGVILHEPIPLFYQVQQSLIDLRIYIEDLIS